MADKQQNTEAVISKLLESEDPQALMQFYEKWSEDYDKDLESINVPQSLLQLASIAAAHLPDTSCRVIDICAGTGLGGQALQQLGFSNIDAIDGSSGMLEKARSKQVYRQLFCELIGHDRICSFPEGSYDAAFASGTFAPGHLGAGHLRAVLAAIKPTGIFATGVRHRYLSSEHHRQLEAEMIRMEEEGLWQRLAWETLEQHVGGQPAKVFVYRKL